MGKQGKGQNRNKDQEIILGFLDGGVKTLVLDSVWDNPKLVVANQQLTFYLDLSPLTLQRRKEWSFLTSKLARYEIAYKWGHHH